MVYSFWDVNQIRLHYMRVLFHHSFNSLYARTSHFNEPVLQHLENACCKPYLSYGCDVITQTKSELSNISYAFNLFCVQLSSIYVYTGQSEILAEIINRHRPFAFATQLLCCPHCLIEYFANVVT